MTTWRMRIACCKPVATNKHSEYVTLRAFPLQQCLHERVSLLWYTYNASIVKYKFRLQFAFETGDINYCNWGYN